MAKGKPGVMMYWEMFDTLSRIKPEKLKTMLSAIRNFSQYGEVPNFNDDEALELVWPLIEQKLVADHEKYERVREQRTNAINARWEKERSKNTEVYEPIQPNTTVYKTERNIPTSTSTTTTTSTATSTGASTTGGKPPRPPKHKHGEYNNVLLTDDELTKLQAEFPSDLQARIDKLSEYIESTGKAYKSHYATIRSWAKRDQEKARTSSSYYPDNPCNHVKSEDYSTDDVNPF